MFCMCRQAQPILIEQVMVWYDSSWFSHLKSSHPGSMVKISTSPRTGTLESQSVSSEVST